jgi:hypothetical protein
VRASGYGQAVRDSSAQVPSIWIVDDDEPFRALVSDVAVAAGLHAIGLDPVDLVDRLRDPDAPDGVMLDGDVGRAQPTEGLTHVPRVVLCSAARYSDLPDGWATRPNVRVLVKPFTVDQLLPALRWLAVGEEADGWETPRPMEEREAPAAI